MSEPKAAASKQATRSESAKAVDFPKDTAAGNGTQARATGPSHTKPKESLTGPLRLSPGHSEQKPTTPPITCLSAEPHDGEDISNTLSHYFGCIEYSKREHFYEGLAAEEKEPIRSEFRRIKFLRDVLEHSDELEDRKALKNVSESYKNWKEKQKAKIQTTGERRREHHLPSGTEAHDPNRGKKGQDKSPYQYEADKDLKAYVIDFNDKGGVKNQSLSGDFPNQKTTVYDLLYSSSSLLKRPDPEGPARSGDNCDEEGKALEGGRDQEKGPKPKPRNIRYFHFPANNMQWVEDAMCRYYGESGTLFDNEFRNVKTRTEANTLLRRDFWYGQEQGHGARATHARHLRPLCAQVSSDPRNSEAEAKNLVLFMPFLHWEKDRQRHNFTDMIDKSASREQNRLHEARLRDQDARRKDRYKIHGLPNDVREHAKECQACDKANRTEPLKRPLDRISSGTGHKPLPETMTAAFSRQPRGAWNYMIPKWPIYDRDGRLRTGRPLGQLLYDAFKLYETLHNYRDRRMIDEYLHHQPRMHTRRTLDQAYYWTLPNTRVRDRDQVVYRQTSAAPQTLHHYEPEPKEKGVEKWTCRREEAKAEKLESETTRGEVLTSFLRKTRGQARGMGRSAGSQKESLADVEQGAPSPEHVCAKKARVLHRTCASCTEAIRKVPRVVMVDQLWMWILDDSTVLTFFPKRYGVNRQDPSGVHKAIRQKLSNISTEKIRSAYDLGRLIVKECTNLFFDRIKTDARQPQVVDIFSEAIGDMAQKSTLFFDHLWHWADELAKAPGNKSSWVELSQIHLALLNITPEGKLQRETKDIIEELGIMLYVWRKQKEVLKSFKKHGGNLLDVDGTFKERRQTITWETPGGAGTPDDGNDADSNGSGPRWTRKECWVYFQNSIDELMEDHEDQMEELDGLRQSAEQVSKSLEHLLALKQQQASVLQAWQAIRHGEEAVKQGRAIMIFTVITIVFLPLAFVAAIFGMNNQAFKDDSMSLKLQLKLMFTTSVGVIVFVILIAFSNTIRTLIRAAVHVTFDYTMIATGLYSLWLEFPEDLRPEKLAHRAQKKMQERKDEVRKRVRRKKRRAEARNREIAIAKRDREYPTIEAALLEPDLTGGPMPTLRSPESMRMNSPGVDKPSISRGHSRAQSRAQSFEFRELVDVGRKQEISSSQTAVATMSGGNGSDGRSTGNT